MLGKRLVPAAVETSAAIILLILALSACAGNAKTPRSDEALPSGISISFPTDDNAVGLHPTPSREGSVAAQFIIDGSDSFSVFGDAETVGTTLILHAAANDYAAVMYKFDLAGDPLLGADIAYAVDGGDGYYGFADFANGTWQIEGPENGNPPDVDLSSGNYTSPGGFFYFFVLAFNSSDLTITNTSVTADVAGGGGPPWTLSGDILDDSAQPIVGAIVHIAFQNKSATTDAGGHYEFTDLADGDYVLVPDAAINATATDSFDISPSRISVSVTADVTQDFTGVPISIPGTVSYATHMRPWLFEPVCMNCHNSAFSGAERHGAPTSVNWDTFDGTTESKKTAGNTRVQTDTMPAPALTFKTNTFQKALFQKWLDGGFQS